MGNCSLKGVPYHPAKGTFNFIRIMTHSGEIIKLESPKLVGDFLIAFPGHKIFGQDHVSLPLSNQEHLVLGKSYYLLPSSDTCYNRCNNSTLSLNTNPDADSGADEKEPVRISSAALEIVTSLANGSGLQVLAPKQKGVWRVKLAISPRQLEEILAEEVNTEALIEKMRMAAATCAADCFTPRRNKRSWGLICKPVLANTLKFPTQSTTS